MARIPVIDLSTTIPCDIHACGYEGVAAAVTYLCCVDIVHDYADRISTDNMERRDQINAATAKSFLLREDNPMYLLDIPGEELIRSLERRTKEAYERGRK